MIQTEMIDDRIRHYSDQNMMIRQVETDILYEDALDVIPCQYTYEETDIPIASLEDDLSPQEALDILLGGGGE